jgi:guanylate kinase
MFISITGPSGTGKDTLIDALLKQDPKLRRCVTANTREPRPGEVDGVHYYFLTKERFAEIEAQDGFLETDKNNYNGNWYGTLRSVIADVFAQGYDSISAPTYAGVAQIEKTMPEHQFRIMLLPPNRERLEQRLTGRNPELADEGRRRLQQMLPDLEHLHNPNYVFQHIVDLKGSSYRDYDAVLINDVLDNTVQEAARLIAAERARRELV